MRISISPMGNVSLYLHPFLLDPRVSLRFISKVSWVYGYLWLVTPLGELRDKLEDIFLLKEDHQVNIIGHSRNAMEVDRQPSDY